MDQNVQDFVKQAQAFFYVRRTKFRNKNSRLPLNVPAWGDWTRLGSGHYGEAWEHEMYPGLVMKISGPSGWGEDYKGACGAESGNDIWPEYAQACMQSPHENLPKVHHLEHHGRLAWGVLPRYDAAPGYMIDSEVVQRFKRAMRREIEAEYWMLPILEVTRLENCTLDLHSGNIMQDPDTGDVIITDPFSAVMAKPYGMDLQHNTWSPEMYPDTCCTDDQFTYTDLTTDEKERTC